MRGGEGGREREREGGREREGDITHKDSYLKFVINLLHVCACVNRNGAGTVLKSTCAFPLPLASAGMGSVEKISAMMTIARLIPRAPSSGFHTVYHSIVTVYAPVCC